MSEDVDYTFDSSVENPGERIALIQAALAAKEKEALDAIKEDICDWLSRTLELTITGSSFFDSLDTGVTLCKLATLIQQTVRKLEAEEETVTVKIPMESLSCNSKAKRGTFFARDNTSNFIDWCRGLGVAESVLFESNGLVDHCDEKRVVLCLLDVARAACSLGMTPPELVRMEREIDELEKEEEATKDVSEKLVEERIPSPSPAKTASPRPVVASPSPTHTDTKISAPSPPHTHTKIPAPIHPSGRPRREANQSKLSPSKTTPPISQDKTAPSKTTPPISQDKITPSPSKTMPPISQDKTAPSKTTPPISQAKTSSSKTTPPISQAKTAPSKTTPPISQAKTTPSPLKTTPPSSHTKTAPPLVERCKRGREDNEGPEQRRKRQRTTDETMEETKKETVDEKVMRRVNECSCSNKFEVSSCGRGKFIVKGGSGRKMTVYARLLSDRVMVRVGGGWDSLDHFLLKHDPLVGRATKTVTVATVRAVSPQDFMRAAQQEQ